MARSVMDRRNLQSLEAVITVARLKESRLSKLLQRAETRLLEQQNLLATLQEYGTEYREKISVMDRSGYSLDSGSLLQRKNLLAMINQVESMKATQAIQVRNVEADLLRIRQAFYKAHLYVENLQKLYEHKKSVLQQQEIKHEEKKGYDEFLTRFASQAPIVNGGVSMAEKIENSAKVI